MTRKPLLVSVVMPARNAADTIGEQLAALRAQTYEGSWEVVVVDNGSTDRTASIVHSFMDRMPRLVMVKAWAERGVGYARNRGIEASSGDLLTFCDADDVVETSWLASLVSAASGYDAVGGVNENLLLNTPELVQGRMLMGEGTGEDRDEILPGGNCAIWRDVFDRIGLWNEELVYGGEDNDLTLRARAAGLRLGFRTQGAVRHYRFKVSLRRIFEQAFYYGRSSVWVNRAHGAAVPWYSTFRLAGGLVAELCRIGWLPGRRQSSLHRARIARIAGKCVGQFVGVVFAARVFRRVPRRRLPKSEGC